MTTPVRIEVFDVDESGNRQIKSRVRVADLLADRREDISAAVGEAAGLVCSSADEIEDREGWRLASLEATFGIKLTADAGVILTRVGAEASLEIKLTVERVK